MANNCVAGECFVKVDGRQLSVRGTLTISPNRKTRDAVAGLDGIHGFTEVFHPQTIEIEITNRPAFPLTDLEDIVDATVTAELQSGEVWVLRNAWHQGDMDFNAADGTVTITFAGMDMRRQMSAAA
jgi:hypothetical protein